jgi:hypothetical protein
MHGPGQTFRSMNDGRSEIRDAYSAYGTPCIREQDVTVHRYIEAERVLRKQRERLQCLREQIAFAFSEAE